MTATARLNATILIVIVIAASLIAAVGTGSPVAAASDDVIVYETYGYYGGPADIHRVNPDGTGDVNLTPDTEDSMELDPQLSPDRTRIVFISNRVTEQNPDGNFEIFTMAIDGAGVTQVTTTEDPFAQGSIQSYNPTWAPDGTQLAFDGYRGAYEASEIYVINVDGTGERQVTSDADFANKWLPDWSPDGTKILFTWGWDYYTQDVRTINPDGTGEETLTDTSAYSAEGSASWSPDGQRIVFSGDGAIPGVYPNPNREIFVMEYPSLVITPVTEHEAVDEDPAWSADGSQITFASPRDGKYALYVIAAPPVPIAATGRALGAAASVSALAESPVRKLDPTSAHEADPFWGGSGAAPPPPVASHTLTVAKTGNGSGAVKSQPRGISCGKNCSHDYPTGSIVTLTATAAAGSTFGGWAGACAGSALRCTVTIDAAKSVTASFALAATTHALTVVKNGRGKVTSAPAGINCGRDCSEAYAGGTVVTLTAAPGRDYTFASWSGACSGGAVSCTVTMNAAKSATATFVRR
jgi:hypothetical protein